MNRRKYWDKFAAYNKLIRRTDVKNMKTTILCTLACLAGISAAAQEGIVKTRPANPSDGKLLTMEEAVLLSETKVKKCGYFWNSTSDSLIFTDVSRSALKVAAVKDLLSGKDACVPFKDSRESLPELPENAANASISPDGKFYAFTVGNGLYLCGQDGCTDTLATCSDRNITYGQFTSRNEFGITGGIFWSDSGKRLAFYRKDESKVGTFPLLDITTRTGSLFEIKYPMAGMDSENVQVGIYDTASGETVYVQADDFGYDQYLTNVSWSPDDRYILIQVLDRSQRHCRLNMYDAATGAFVRTLLTEDNDRFVEPQNPVWFLKGSTSDFIYRTDNRDGYKNLYLCDTEGNISRLTCTDADVEYVGNDGKYVFYTSAEVSPVQNHLFKVNVRNGKTARLTFEEGWHDVTLSPDCRYFIDSYSNLTTPYVVSLKSTDGKSAAGLYTAADPTEGYAYCQMDFGTVKSADGKYDNWYRLIKPKDFDPSKKYPVILYVYGGPHSQLVKDTWLAELRPWEMYMAQRGYLVYVQDNRGTLNQGAEYEKAIHGQCGQAEMADQMEGIKMLMSLPFVDKERIGVHGWSYGGFMTISLITNYPDIFKVAVAGGPVIDWKWYEVMYGERYMGHPDENKAGYEKVSLINKAKDLKGKLLICQGAVDNVVVWEHSLSFIRECIKNNVQVDYFPYPCAQHNVMGRDRIHLMDKVTMYFEDYL